MDEFIPEPLTVSLDAPIRDRLVDITTIGAWTGTPRRIEIMFHALDGAAYLTGTPGPRSWRANLLHQPQLTVHAKGADARDYHAIAQPISDHDQRARLLPLLVAEIVRLYEREGDVPSLPPSEEWIADSPLVRVAFPRPSSEPGPDGSAKESSPPPSGMPPGRAELV